MQTAEQAKPITVSINNSDFSFLTTFGVTTSYHYHNYIYIKKSKNKEPRVLGLYIKHA